MNKFLFLIFLSCGASAQEWRLPDPHKNVCYGEKASVIWGNGFDGKIDDAVNIRDELLKLPWKDVYVFLSPRQNQWGTNELCVTLARMGQYLYEKSEKKNFAIENTAVVGIGDISLRNGRRFAKHIAHQTGLEADIFYLRKPSSDSLPNKHRWKRRQNRFPERMIAKKKLSANFDLIENFRAFAFLQKEFGLWITTDQTVIDQIKTLRDQVDSSQLDFFLENSQHVSDHEDHFHIGLNCPTAQIHCKNEWGEWHRIRRSGKKWKFMYN